MDAYKFRKFVIDRIKNFEKRIAVLEKENKILKELLENEDIVLEAKDDDIVASKKSWNIFLNLI